MEECSARVMQIGASAGMCLKVSIYADVSRKISESLDLCRSVPVYVCRIGGRIWKVPHFLGQPFQLYSHGGSIAFESGNHLVPR